MKKILLSLMVLVLAFNVSFAGEAEDAEKGKDVYKEKLKPLMDDMEGKKFTSAFPSYRWKAMFKDGAKKFIEEYSTKYPKAKDYLNSDAFKGTDLKFIEAFALHYASDKGNLPSCK